MRITKYEFPEDTTREVLRENGICDDEDGIMTVSITSAKKLLKQYGGYAYTMHCSRDGEVFEVSDIVLEGNNSQFKYNHHL